VVQNVEGAGGTLGAGEVADAPPDGQKVLMYHIGMSTSPSLYPDLTYKPLESFKTIGVVTTVPMTIIAKSDFPPNTFAEMVEYVKANADSVNLAHAGKGAASHLCGLLMQKAMGVKLNEVAYKGTGPAMTDLLGGQVDLMCDQTTNTTSHIQAKKVKAYAATTADRVSSLPDLPTTTEAGMPDLQVGVWHGLYVPAETPDAVVAKLTEALKVALKDQTVIDKMADLGTTPASEAEATPAALTKLLTDQIALWEPILKEAS
jgi:tripartite-type tricarboxylate transporter receptor subunit TctC